jgi:GntR family transcriptional regulator/MocR family aminotransferase
MAKRSTAFELALPAREAGTAAARWLYSSLRTKILDGRLRPLARLPATRDLARQYRLSRGTIINAFEQLESEGYINGVTGSGTFVSKILPDELLQVRAESGSAPRVSPRPKRRVSDYAKRAKLFSGFELRPSYAFRANLPALDLFPATLWAQIASRRLRGITTNHLLGCDPMGYQPLREAVAGYLSTSRGVRCAAEQVAIVSGVQEGLDLVARLFLNPGDRVAMESPGYLGAAMVFEAVGAKVIGVPLDDQGLEIREHRLRLSRLLYVTPGHQFPLGTAMSLGRRMELLAWARKSGALIFEDDYDSEFRYSGRPIPAMQGLDCNRSVIFAGSFSKVLFPSLRLGYLVIPPDLLDHFAAIQSLTRRHVPLLDQAILCDFINGGHFGRHLRRMREVYAERLAVLLQSAQEHLAGLLEISSIEAGLQTVGWLHPGISAAAAAEAARARKVEVVPLGVYTRGRLRKGALQLGFASVDPAEIRRGVRDLAVALNESLAGHSG